MTIRIGTRGSRLALVQTETVARLLREAWPGIEVSQEIIKTKGDRILDTALSRIGEKGLFTKELEAAILDRRVDLAVHSLKDLPTKIPEGLAIGAILRREDPSDALISASRKRLAELPAGATIGTSSLRRRAQLLALRPDLSVVDLRGNVPTRLAKVERGDVDAVVLACAGLARLRLEDRIDEVLGPERMLPAVGQGAIAVEIRSDDRATAERLARLDHRGTRLAVAAERAFLSRLEGGCQVPIGAHARLDGSRLSLAGLVAGIEGSPCYRGDEAGDVHSEDDAAAIGRRLAERLLAEGAGTILRELSGRDPLRAAP